MNVLKFLDSALPASGARVIGLVDETGKFRGFKAFASNAECAAKGAAYDAMGWSVYLAPASFKGWYEDIDAASGRVRRRIKTRTNVLAHRSLVDDFDVGEGGCATKQDAYNAVLTQARAMGLKPWVVDSGGGYHVYTALDRDLAPQEWMELSILKRRITDHLGLSPDKSVDMDPSHTLRLPGSHNRKRSPHALVKVVHTGAVHRTESVKTVLESYIAQHGVPELAAKTRAGPALPPPPTHLVGTSAGWNGAADQQMPASDPEIVATECAAVRAFRDGSAPLPYPHWSRAVGLVKHCTDGEAKVHEWSARDPRYDRGETQALLDSLEHGPTTCDAFDAVLGCKATCPHATLVRSPIRLGEPEDVTPAPQGNSPAAQPFHARWLPKNYSIDTKTGWVWWSDGASEEPTSIPVARRLTYPIARLEELDGTWLTQFRAERPGKAMQDFGIPTGMFGDMRNLVRSFAEKEVLICDHPKSAHKFMELCKMQLDRATKHLKSHRALTQMGWLEAAEGRLEGFAMGNKIVLPNGRSEAKYSTSFPTDFRIDMGRNGTLQEWIDGIDALYNRPGAEPIQFALLHSMGSPLVRLADSSNWHGLPLVFTGDGGTGKSTACKIAGGFWGRPKVTERQAHAQGTTVGAMITRVQALGDVPFIMDEASGWTPDILSQLMYALANGRGKERLNQRGRLETTGEEWFKNSVITANDNVYEALSRVNAQARAEATQLRVFEVRLPKGFMQTVFSGSDRKAAEDHMNLVYGAPAEPYLRHIMNNTDAIKERLRDERFAVIARDAEETRERFYRDAVATAMVAGEIGVRMGLVKFDLDAIRTWAQDHIEHLRASRRELNPGPAEHLASFLTSLEGRMITTQHFRNKGPQEGHMGPPLREPVGRVAKADRVVYLLTGALAEWCSARGVAKDVLINEMVRTGLIVVQPDGRNYCRENIAKRTESGGSRTWCYQLDYDRYFGLRTRGKAQAANVVQFPPGGQPAAQTTGSATSGGAQTTP